MMFVDGSITGVPENTYAGGPGDILIVFDILRRDRRAEVLAP